MPTVATAFAAREGFLTLERGLTFVGLGSKAWGELTLGRQYTHQFHTIAVGSAAAYATFASNAGQIPELTRASDSITRGSVASCSSTTSGFAASITATMRSGS